MDRNSQQFLDLLETFRKEVTETIGDQLNTGSLSSKQFQILRAKLPKYRPQLRTLREAFA